MFVYLAGNHTIITISLLFLHLPNSCHGDESPPESLKHTVRKRRGKLVSVVFALLRMESWIVHSFQLAGDFIT